MIAIDTNGQNVILSGNLNSPGGTLTKSGSGTLTLSGSSTYTGPTTVVLGTVIVSGSLGASAVSVSTSGTFGSGANTTSTVGLLSIASDNSGGGMLTPGGSGGSALTTVGKLNVNGALSLGSSASTTGKAHFVMELGGSSAGVSYDQVAMQVASTLSLSNVNLEGSLINGYTPAVGSFNFGTMFFLVIGAGTVSGTFANQLASNFYSGGYNRFIMNNQEFLISYAANYNGGTGSSFTGGHDIALIAVPEPGAPFFVFTGSAMLAFLQRQRRRIRGGNNC